MEEDEFKDFTKEQLLQKETIETVLAVPSPDMRERFIAKLEVRAKELKIAQNFKRLFKVVQAEMIQAKKQINSNETQFTNQPLKLKCKNYVCTDMGVLKTEFNATLMTTIDTIVCVHPILPIERLINVDTNTEKVKLAFYKDKRWQTVIAEKNTLASKAKILQLANTGIEVNESNAKELILYISDLLAINTEKIPCNKAVTRLGWIEDGFVPYISEYKFDGEKEFGKFYSDVKEKGDQLIWLNTLRNVRKNKTIKFMIAASFASILTEKLNINPYIVHLWGKSGTGKSVALIIAMSVWGNPLIGNLVKNLNTSDVGFERAAAFFHNIPFAGDELQAVKNKYNNFNELIYKLTQGEGRIRGNIEGGLAEHLKWSCSFLFTGEEPITSETSKEGVKNRVIEIEENESLMDKPKQVVDTLTNNYGFGGRKFIEIIPTDVELKTRHMEIFSKLNEKYESTGKQTNAIAAVLLADEMVSKYIFEDSPLTIEDAEKYFAKDIDEAERIYSVIVDWLFANINKFESSTATESWGKYIEIGDDKEKNVQCFYINSKVLRDFLNSNSINFNGIKNKLLEKGILEKNSQGRFTHQTTVNGKVQNLIKLNIIENQQNVELPF